MDIEKLVNLFQDTHNELQSRAARSVDTYLVVRNWLFGWYIVEFENGGAERAELYGKELIKKLSEKLTANLGKGFSKRSLEQFRQFYLTYKEITQALPAQYEKRANAISPTVSDKCEIVHEFEMLHNVQTVSGISENLISETVPRISKSDSLVELTLPKDSNIYASSYQLYLPSKEELKQQIEEAEREFSKNK